MKIASSTNDIPTQKPLYLYGAGQGGAVTLAALRKAGGYDVRGFVDTYKSGEQDGLPVATLEQFLHNKPADALVVIVSQYYLEIGAQLRQAGVRDYVNAHPLVMALLRARAARARLIRVAAAAAAVLAVILWAALG